MGEIMNNDSSGWKIPSHDQWKQTGFVTAEERRAKRDLEWFRRRLSRVSIPPLGAGGNECLMRDGELVSNVGCGG